MKKMKTLESTPKSTWYKENLQSTINSSIIVAAVYLVIFLIAKIFSLQEVTWLRFLNYVVLFPIVYGSVGKYYVQHKNYINYFQGFSMGFLIGALGSLYYSIIFYFYLKFDPIFMKSILNKLPEQIIYPEISIAFINFSEGLSFSVIVALAIMQLYKKQGSSSAEF